MYTVSFAFTNNFNCGLSLSNIDKFKKTREALQVARKLSVLYPNKPDTDLAIATTYQLILFLL